ncbi:hypothetical protein [Sporolactobacillus laevolacticus]|uniref:hypothetical protein n=1 Tax=Sporolactobacillus laevolacticus TaxID=33018 RepID=UPI0025B49B7E|nr:hypothetical protein [Sporolactobacillus laevolacticus]MDN3953786.1 hypothetical protein [Sporolactobacillus laevolacticus]
MNGILPTIIGASASLAGTILGFALNQIANRTGKIKIFVQNSYFSSTENGKERRKQLIKGLELSTVEIDYLSTERCTIYYEILFFNTSKSNKVVIDLSLESEEEIGIPFYDLSKHDGNIMMMIANGLKTNQQKLLV